MGLRSGKNQAHKDVQSKGLISRLTKYIGIGGRATAADAENTFYPTRDSENGKDWENIAGAEEGKGVELGSLLRLGDPTVVGDSQAATKGSDNESDGQNVTDAGEEEGMEPAHSTPTKVAKRKRDIYPDAAHPEEDAKEDGQVEVPAHKPFKRAKTGKKAKAPLASPKTRTAATVQRQTQRMKKAVSKEPEPETNPSISSSAGANGVGQSSETARKRGPGRPRKKPPAVIPESLSEQPVDATEEGVSDILLDPSPVKPILPEPQRLKPAERLQKTGSHPLSSGLSAISDLEDEDEDEDEVAMSGPALDVPEDGNDLEDELPKTLKDVMPVKDLEEMLEMVRQVGQRQDRKTKQWKKQVTKDKPHSIPGERILRRLKGLIKAYSALQNSKTAGNENAADVVQAKVVKIIESIMEETEIVFTERLGNPTHGVPYPDKESIHNMVTDIYFFLVPGLVEGLKLGVEVHQGEDFSKSEALKEIVDLLDLLQRLGEGALQQPKANTNNQYRTSLPTKSILPIIRPLLKALRIELRRREHNKKIAAWNRGAVERERKRAAKEEREYEERRRQRNQIYRMQQEVINAKLKQPLYGHYLQTKIEREEVKKAEMQAARSSQSRPYSNSQRSSAQGLDDEDMQDDPFDDQFERISVFGSNNTGKDRAPKPLSREEKQVFIRIMQFEQSEIQSIYSCPKFQVDSKLILQRSSSIRKGCQAAWSQYG